MMKRFSTQGCENGPSIFGWTINSQKISVPLPKWALKSGSSISEDTQPVVSD